MPLLLPLLLLLLPRLLLLLLPLLPLLLLLLLPWLPLRRLLRRAQHPLRSSLGLLRGRGAVAEAGQVGGQRGRPRGSWPLHP